MSFSFFCLTENVLGALEGDRYRFEIRGTAYSANRFGASRSVYNVFGIGDEYSIDHIIGIPVCFFQIKLQALPEEYPHRTGVVRVRKLLLGLGPLVPSASIVHDL